MLKPIRDKSVDILFIVGYDCESLPEKFVDDSDHSEFSGLPALSEPRVSLLSSIVSAGNRCCGVEECVSVPIDVSSDVYGHTGSFVIGTDFQTQGHLLGILKTSESASDIEYRSERYAYFPDGDLEHELPAARSAERARTRCPGRSTQGVIRPERITRRRLLCAGRGRRRPASDRQEAYRRWQPDARCVRLRAARTGPVSRPRLRIAGSKLPASTLVEVLILMILSGVVFLSIMDGFGLLNRFLDRTSQRISEQTEQYAGYFRTVDLAGDSDSLISEGERTLALYRKGGIHARLSLADSALIVRQDERSDTLLRNVVRLRTVPEPVPGARIDTMIVELRSEQDSVLSIGFLPRRPPDPLLEKLSEQEAKYRYEENENESNEESK